ncbi:MAG: extracellular solute-binding protein [Clostridiales bacterium]|nr:extracellular solute-binding protein [Clostridiales bacterium]
MTSKNWEGGVEDAGIRIAADMPQPGDYSIALTFAPAAETMLEHLLEVEVNGAAVTVFATSLWVDEDTKYFVDAAGNEYSPRQKNLLEPVCDYLFDYGAVNREPAVFRMPAGSAEIIVRSASDDLVVYGAILVPCAAPPSYAEYYAAESAARGEALGSDIVAIEAENYSVRSDSFISVRGTKSLYVSPHDTYRNLGNVIGGAFWYSPGKKILWEFSIESEGFYYISLNCAQDDKTGGIGMNVYRTVEIDGKSLFSELEAAPFPYTGVGRFITHNVKAGAENAKIYLEKGPHTIALTSTTGRQAEAIAEIKLLMSEINAIGMDLRKLAAGTADKNRTWDMGAYMPHVIPALSEFADRIDGLYEKVWRINGTEPTIAAGFAYASSTLRKLVASSRTLPNRTALLNEGDTSVTAALGDMMNQLTRQAMTLDRIYIYGENAPEIDEPSMVEVLGESLHMLARSFSPASNAKFYNTGANGADDALTVWVNRPIQYSESLRALSDRDFRSPDGAGVYIVSFNDINKLILTNATGTNPDIVIGLQYEKLYDYALRGAALELTQFADFLPFYAEHYNTESLAPVSYDGKIYGAVDSNKLRLLFYRADVMEALGLEIPQTWDDVHRMMPTLLRYAMNFNLPLVNEVGNRNLDMLGPFYFQRGGAFYEPDGASTAIGTDAAIAGFTEMVDLFRVYGLRKSVPNFFNSFRYGEVPIGVADEQTYLQLQLVAPELAGKWGIAQVPGVLREDGEIDRSYPVAATASMIFSSTGKPEAAYDFLKWWLSTDTQVRYAYDLHATSGPEFYWNPANLDAMAQLYYPPDHMEVILGQLGWEKESARHPAGYMVERQIADAWNKVVAESKNKMVSIDYAKLVSDREIVRKLQEFGYLDENGNALKEFVLGAPGLPDTATGVRP